METKGIIEVIQGLYREYIGVIYRKIGKEHANYYNGIV